MVHRLPKHPEPGVDLARTDLPLASWDRSLFRIHRLKKGPLHFGTSGDNRFDDPEGRYGVLYASATWLGAFIETAGHHTGHPFVTTTWLSGRSLAVIDVRRKLRLIDLRGRGLARLGADARLAAGEHALAQRWSRALWEHPAEADGISYISRHDSRQVSVALFDRSEKALRPRVLGSLGSRGLEPKIAEALNHYSFGLIVDT